MNIRKTLLLTLIVAIVSLGLSLTGCEKKSDHPTAPEHPEHPTTSEHPEHPTTAPAETAALCTKCGQVVGSEACCKPGAEKCDKCGLDKGSPGCCKLEKATEEVKEAVEEAAKAVEEAVPTEHPEHPQ